MTEYSKGFWINRITEKVVKVRKLSQFLFFENHPDWYEIESFVESCEDSKFKIVSGHKTWHNISFSKISKIQNFEKFSIYLEK